MRLVLAIVLAGALAAPAGAVAVPPQWAPADQATIRPGSSMDTERGGSCTANFVFYNATEVYLGYAAHCANDEFGEEACRWNSLPLGTPVQIEGATRPGQLAYSSWATMTALAHPTDDFGTCGNNDLALVRVDPADHGRVNPTVPFFGGPLGLRRDGVARGEQVLSYGNSGLRAGIEPLKPREGIATVGGYDGWEHNATFVTPAVWGDSGSAALDGAGAAIGVVVTISATSPGANGITDLARALDYMESHGGPQVTLAMATEPFTGGRAPALVDSPEPQPDPEPAPAPAPPAPASATPSPPPPAGQPSQPASQQKAKAKARKRKRCRRSTRRAGRRPAERRRRAAPCRRARARSGR